MATPAAVNPSGKSVRLTSRQLSVWAKLNVSDDFYGTVDKEPWLSVCGCRWAACGADRPGLSLAPASIPFPHRQQRRYSSALRGRGIRSHREGDLLVVHEHSRRNLCCRICALYSVTLGWSLRSPGRFCPRCHTKGSFAYRRPSHVTWTLVHHTGGIWTFVVREGEQADGVCRLLVLGEGFTWTVTETVPLSGRMLNQKRVSALIWETCVDARWHSLTLTFHVSCQQRCLNERAVRVRAVWLDQRATEAMEAFGLKYSLVAV